MIRNLMSNGSCDDLQQNNKPEVHMENSSNDSIEVNQRFFINVINVLSKVDF